MESKVISARQAVSLVNDGDVLALHGAGGGNVEPDLLIKTLRDRYLETKEPRNLTLFHVSGLGDRKTTGLGYLAHEGLVKRGGPLRHGSPDVQAGSGR